MPPVTENLTLTRQEAVSWLKGHRKLIIWFLAMLIVVLNKKLGLDLTPDDITKAISWITGTFMAANGLEHIGEAGVEKAKINANTALMMQRPQIQTPASLPPAI
jgi:hypothetical protein